MNGYFKLLRRKLGVVTLVLACVLTVAWMRSTCTLDRVVLPAGANSFRLLLLYDGKIEIETIYKNRSSQVPTKSFKEAFASITKYRWSPSRTATDKAQSQFHTGWDSHIDNRELGVLGPDFTRTVKSVPFWSIVLPVTLLSAYLLLSKPRTKASQSKLDA